MVDQSRKLKILVVQAWTRELEPIRAALRSAELYADFTRVDIEAALEAALHWADYELVLCDPDTATLPREIVERTLDVHGCRAPLVYVDDLATLGARVRDALDDLRN